MRYQTSPPPARPAAGRHGGVSWRASVRHFLLVTGVATVATAAVASGAAATVQPGPQSSFEIRPKGETRPALTLGVATADPRQGEPLLLVGRARPPSPGYPVALQTYGGGATRARGWRNAGWTYANSASTFAFRQAPTAGTQLYRVVMPGRGWVSKPISVRVAPPWVDAIAQPQDQRTVATVTNAIRTATASVDIVVYNQGSSDIAAALVVAKARLAANRPVAPSIRVMVNGQWNSASKTQTQNAYVAQMMAMLGVDPTTGRSADGVVGFNYSSTNFSLTHQKTLVIDARKRDGTEYPNAKALPATARAIVATFNLQALGWPWTYQGATPGTNCSAGNTTCSFVGGGQGTRDFGVILRRPSEVFTIERVYSSDFSGPTPSQSNLALGLNDPNRLLVWSNGTLGVAAPPPTGFGTIFSPTAASYPVFSGDTAGSGFYPYPYYQWVAAAQASPSQVKLGAVAGNANAVHLGIINAAAAAAQAGRPAALYIYNEEYVDSAVLAAINHAAAVGVRVRIVMSFNSSAGYGYQQLVTTTRPNGQPVDAQIHLYPTTNDYMYIHAKMIYADLDSDEMFAGSQNFSENSLLQNRELGVHLRQSDGSLSPGVRALFAGTFVTDYNYLGANVSGCPVVVVSPAHTWDAQSAGLNSNTGCPNSSSKSPGAPADVRESNAAVTNGASSFPAPLANVSNDFSPPLPQGPIRTFVAPDPVVVCTDGTRQPQGSNCPVS